jgi:hypothetical protein
VLLRPVDRRLTQLAIAFAFGSLAVESVGALHLHAVLTPLHGGAYLASADPALLHVLAYQSVVAHAHAFGLALHGTLFPFILLPSLVGESTFCLWLLIKGVDVAAWVRRTNVMHGPASTPA